jgi:hypothetical protein
MTTDPATPGYSHTQTGPLCLILYASAFLCFALAVGTDDTPGVSIAVAVGGVLALLGPAIHHLKVEDRGDRLAIRFGPLPLLRTSVRYADIVAVEVGRTLVLDGWGVHYSVRGGWVWNLWGRACVVVKLKNGGTLRIGTDDAENLVRFLETRTGGRGT